MLDVIDRFWLFRKAEPMLLILVGVGAIGSILLGWWVGWAVGNHMIGAGLAGAAGLAIGVAWERLRQRYRRARP